MHFTPKVKRTGIPLTLKKLQASTIDEGAWKRNPQTCCTE